MTAEERRLEETRQRKAHWNRWGPFLSERAWGTVREDYSPDGAAWEYLPHEYARSKAYRWNEDGLAGICDRHQKICFALALWNGRDPILKERLFGLTGNEGNHGEDVKECYYYLDNTPTHSYMKYLYKYPQAAFPYAQLLAENRARTPPGAGIRTGGYRGFRREPLLRRVRGVRQGFAGRYSDPHQRLQPRARSGARSTCCPPSGSAIRGCGREGRARCCVRSRSARSSWTSRTMEPGVCLRKGPELLFTDNETNYRRLYGVESPGFVKDGINDYVVDGDAAAINPARTGTKAAAHYAADDRGGGDRRSAPPAYRCRFARRSVRRGIRRHLRPAAGARPTSFTPR